MIRLFLASAVVCAFAADSVAQTYNSEAQQASRLGFGSAVAMSADEIAVTEPTNDYSSGFVYIYRKDRGNWERALRLQAPDAERADRFGASLAMSGNSLVVGATSQNDGHGAVYVFEKDPSGEWAASARVTAQEPTKELGRAVAVQGKWMIAGSSGDNDMAGTAYLFNRTEDGSWAQKAALKADSSQAMTGYASNVSLAKGVALVSAPMEDKGGVVYTFRYDESTMTWKEDEPLVGSESSERDQFGMRIAVEGNEMLISAPGAGGRAGIVYLYSYDESSERWIESRILRPFDAPRFAGFGTALAFNEGDLWIGAPYANRFEGTIYSYDRDGDSWNGVSKVSLEGLSRGAFFGASIAAVGKTAVVGLTGSDFGAGSAVILQHSDAGWVSASRLEGDPTGLETVSGGRVSCEDGEANIFKCDRVDLISFVPVAEIGGGRGVRVNDMWGWEDKLTGREYALVGRVDGTSFVDVTDPSQPIYLGNLDRSAGAPPSIWRDIKVYKDHAYIVADGAEQHGMQVFDLTQLRNVRERAGRLQGDRALRQDRECPQHRDQRGHGLRVCRRKQCGRRDMRRWSPHDRHQGAGQSAVRGLLCGSDHGSPQHGLQSRRTVHRLQRPGCRLRGSRDLLRVERNGPQYRRRDRQGCTGGGCSSLVPERRILAPGLAHRRSPLLHPERRRRRTLGPRRRNADADLGRRRISTIRSCWPSISPTTRRRITTCTSRGI